MTRSIAPKFFSDFPLILPELVNKQLQNGRTLRTLYSSTIDVFRLELVFPVGYLHSDNLQTIFFLPKIWPLGSKFHNAYQISEEFEKLGGFFEISFGLHRTTVTLHGMSKYFSSYLDLLFEVTFQPIFSEEEFNLQKKQGVKAYLVNVGKPSYQANKAFKKKIYKGQTILSETISKKDIETAQAKDLVDFHQTFFKSSTFDIFLCGNFNQHNLELLEEHISNFKDTGKKEDPLFPPIIDCAGRIDITVPKATQSSIILGKRLFNRRHPDFIKFLVTNTVLGGYFGSRLMRNIREEKGLTYGISSSLISNGVDGVFSIKAELNSDKLELALEEIQREISILQTEVISNEELLTVKNYIKGSVLQSTNTIFDIMDKHKAMIYEQLPADFYSNMSSIIDQINSDDLVEMSNAYLKDFCTIIAG